MHPARPILCIRAALSGLWLAFVAALPPLSPVARGQAPDFFAPLVNGVAEITAAPGVASPLFALSPEWRVIASGDEDTTGPSAFVLARQFGAGRVVAVGHSSLLEAATLAQRDNRQFMSNVVRWLDVSGTRAVLHTTGHEEVPVASDLATALPGAGYSFGNLSAPLSTPNLAAGSVLTVAQANGTFTTNEIEAVRQFVTNGGGLLILAVGWPWEPYHPGQTMEDFPMTKLGAPFGLRFLRSIPNDPTNQTNGTPVLRRFFPQALGASFSDATNALALAHAAHGTNLPAALETNAMLRASVVDAHALLAVPAAELPAGHELRTNVVGFYLGLMQSHSNLYARLAPFDETAVPTATRLRERVWRTLRDTLPLTPDFKAQLLAAGGWVGRARDILQEFDVMVLDNLRLSTAQIEHLHRLLSLTPRSLHDLHALTVNDFLGNPPLPVSLEGQPGQVNIFNIAVGSLAENSFPADVAPGVVDTFAIVVAHELNHEVDRFAVAGSTNLSARRAQLLQQAGNPALNYLRSLFTDGFFTNAPQEFVASIANQWFTDSAKCFDLGMARLAGGRSAPLNQALFFAELYSLGGSSTCFYTNDAAANLQRFTVPLARDGSGRITALQIGSRLLTFGLDAGGNVTNAAVTVTSTPAVSLARSGSLLVLSWPAAPLGFRLEFADDLRVPATWSPTTHPPVLVDNQNSVHLPVPPNRRFFRLAQP